MGLKFKNTGYIYNYIYTYVIYCIYHLYEAIYHIPSLLLMNTQAAAGVAEGTFGVARGTTEGPVEVGMGHHEHQRWSKLRTWGIRDLSLTCIHHPILGVPNFVPYP